MHMVRRIQIAIKEDLWDFLQPVESLRFLGSLELDRYIWTHDKEYNESYENNKKKWTYPVVDANITTHGGDIS